MSEPGMREFVVLEVIMLTMCLFQPPAGRRLQRVQPDPGEDADERR